MNFVCTECGEQHDLSGVIEEAEQNGYSVEEVQYECSECGEVTGFERSVAEL